MIAALILALIGAALAGLPAPWCLFALVVVPPAIWLLCGGGERWLARRLTARRLPRYPVDREAAS